MFGTPTARHARLSTCSVRLRFAMYSSRRVRYAYGSPCTVAEVLDTSMARHARLPTCSARLRLAMHGSRRVRHVFGSPFM
ncbi:unnamed protein product [Heligmosomoides polygyrus]|uniref:Secreted protein n=1 Tax=Heligmosomoides polygyrus TaxID=6339 RepID=A0A183FT36_HELPZ|nr:unnamed protein product [Heligmosomoides polygyrus]